MRLFKRLFFICILCLLIFTAIGFTLPEQYTVKREAIIMAKPDVVFNELQNMLNWSHWNPWNVDASEKQIEYSQISFGEGAWQRWKSKSLGTGEIVLKKVMENEMIVYQRSFSDYNLIATGEFLIEPSDNDNTKITWKDSFNCGNNILKRYFGLFTDIATANDIEKGLLLISNRIEKKKFSLW